MRFTYQNSRATGNGMTVIELLVAVGVLALVAALVIGALSRFRSRTFLRQASDEATGLLREARERTLASRDDRVWGVHFASTSLTLFPGGVYQSGGADQIVVALPPNIEIDAILLATTTASIIFERFTGESRATGTVRFRDRSSGETTVIEILPSGLFRPF